MDVLSRWRAEDRKEIIGEEWRKISRILDRFDVSPKNFPPKLDTRTIKDVGHILRWHPPKQLFPNTNPPFQHRTIVKSRLDLKLFVVQS